MSVVIRGRDRPPPLVSQPQPHRLEGEWPRGTSSLSEETLFRGYSRVRVDAPSCRVCGCTDDRACPGGCSWVEPDLCSACDDTT